MQASTFGADLFGTYLGTRSIGTSNSNSLASSFCACRSYSLAIATNKGSCSNFTDPDAYAVADSHAINTNSGRAVTHAIVTYTGAPRCLRGCTGSTRRPPRLMPGWPTPGTDSEL